MSVILIGEERRDKLIRAPFYVLTNALKFDAITDVEAADIIPQFWLTKAIGRLRANVVVAALVRKDYSDVTGRKGEIITVPKRGSLTAVPKVQGVAIVPESPANTKIDVAIDQHQVVAWSVEDVTNHRAVEDGLNYFNDGVDAVVEGVETFLLGLYPDASAVIGTPATPLDTDIIFDARQALNDNNVKTDERFMVVSSADETALLKQDQFKDASATADGGEALRNATLGNIGGFTIFMSQLVVETAGPITHNLAFKRDGIVLASRPLAPVMNQGITSIVRVDPETGLALRYNSGFSITTQEHVNTIDILYGGAVVDDRKVIEVQS